LVLILSAEHQSRSGEDGDPYGIKQDHLFWIRLSHFRTSGA